ncbi:cytochrome P450 [Roridomyces roridus]|uniref:Cytochrome P450 n=1 Tax=Roridomyces roridus TaxID=1738132 RepID=A0AAD7G0R2_9AGAR|nr:cytochrome P450 [Roridomyces roridus]
MPIWRNTRKSLLGESLTLLGAGSETVGKVVTTGVLHLDREWPDAHARMNYQALEKLPYPTAAIKESVRLAHGPSDALIAGVCIPAGTIALSGITFIHENPEMFEESQKFWPQCWLQDRSSKEQFFVPFSKGPRTCLGIE